MSARIALLALALCARVVHAAPDAGVPEAHGVADAFARPGVALAWGVLRGASEADTFVVVRVETSAPEYAYVSADGVDPFTQSRRAVHGPTHAAGGVDLAFQRAHFAAFPRTEFHFSASDAGTAPLFTVYYLGVPDTTPEFPTRAALARYLADRLARERAASGLSK